MSSNAQRFYSLILIWASLSAHSFALHNLIEVDLLIDEATPSFQFSWTRDDSNGPDMEISRRQQGQLGASTWTPLTTLPRTTTTWTDSTINSGVTYEYRFFIPTDDDFLHPTAAYVSCGIEVPLVDSRGTVLLVVDNTLTSSLEKEIQRFEMDLVGDGWTIQRLEFGRNGNATPEALRTAIQTQNTITPLSCIVLLGNLPIVTSGLIRPDEHNLYRQATDLFYADLDGVWEDSLATSYEDQPNFYPNDGHYDHATIPGPNFQIEVPIGRIDLSGLNAWNESEIELLRRYLDKNHNFRHLRYATPRKAYYTSLAFDESPIEAAAVRAMVGAANAVEAYDDQTEQTQEFLWGISARDWDGNNYPNYRFKSQFTVNFASGKQVWHYDNNPMRAMLAMPWYGLTCVWGVRPNWFLHHTGMGETIGYSNFRTVNNNDNGGNSGTIDYLPVDELNSTDFPEGVDGYVHLNLMGDPTLRIHPVSPAKNLTATLDAETVNLTWTASDDLSANSYHVYTATNALGPYARLTAIPQAALSYSTSPPIAETYYMVRSIKLENTPLGTYWNAGQGIFTKISPTNANSNPAANAATIETTANSSIQVTVTGSDSDEDPLLFSIASNASHGEVSGTAPNFTYTPEPDFDGTDSFQFNVWDGLAESTGTITITVTEGEPEPLTFPEWQSSINWLGEDSSAQADPDKNGLSNEWEYYLGRDPLLDDGGLYSRQEFVQEDEGLYFLLEFRRRKNLPNLIMQVSDNSLSNWISLEPDGVSVIERIIETDQHTELVELKHKTSELITSRFLRFAVNSQ